METKPREQITKELFLEKIDTLKPGETFYFSTSADCDTFGITKLSVFDGDILLLGYLGGQPHYSILSIKRMTKIQILKIGFATVSVQNLTPYI